jgi:hypothetical protein
MLSDMCDMQSAILIFAANSQKRLLTAPLIGRLLTAPLIGRLANFHIFNIGQLLTAEQIYPRFARRCRCDEYHCISNAVHVTRCVIGSTLSKQKVSNLFLVWIKAFMNYELWCAWQLIG